MIKEVFPIVSVFPLASGIAAVWGKVWPIALAILFFGVIIALHEFGHFITAKLFKIQVNEYAIGMGPAFFKKKRGETQYSLRVFPIGGYCAMEGEDEVSENPRAFNNQKAWKRFIVVAAGATVNILLGLLLISVMLGIDGRLSTRVVAEVTETTQAAGTDLQVGDKIVRVNGTYVFSSNDLYYNLYRDADRTYDIELVRDGKKVKLTDAKIGYDPEQGEYGFYVYGKKATVLNILPGAVTETASMTKLIWLSLIDMVGGKYSLNEISGPVGTISIVAETASSAASEADYSMIIFLLAFITVNIGLVNLLPLPALDGGRLLFIFIEMIFRKPVPKKFEAWVHFAGFILLIGLMILITFNDIRNLIFK